jgi:hypothetical protein
MQSRGINKSVEVFVEAKKFGHIITQRHERAAGYGLLYTTVTLGL